MTAEQRLMQAQSRRAVELGQALDIALVEYSRRYGNVRFKVAAVHVTERGVEFTVTPA